MSAPLLDCTIVEQCALIQYLWSEGIKSSEIHRKLLAQYGENCIMQMMVYQWVERFQTCRTSVVNEEHSCHPTISQMVDSV